MSSLYKKPPRGINAMSKRHNCILDNVFFHEESTQILVNELIPDFFRIFQGRYGKMIEPGLENLRIIMNENNREKLLVFFFCTLDKEVGVKEWISTCRSPFTQERGEIFFPALRLLTTELILKRMNCAEFLERVFYSLLYDTDRYANGYPLPIENDNVPPSLHAKEKVIQSHSLIDQIHSDPLPRKQTALRIVPES